MPQGGRYILCDRCKRTTFSINQPWNRDGETMAAARQAGWRIVREEDVNYVEDVCPCCVAAESLVIGQTYRALNQGVAITPQSFDVTIVWLDGKDVHYRRDGETEVRQTPVERFLEIIQAKVR